MTASPLPNRTEVLDELPADVLALVGHVLLDSREAELAAILHLLQVVDRDLGSSGGEGAPSEQRKPPHCVGGDRASLC